MKRKTRLSRVLAATLALILTISAAGFSSGRAYAEADQTSIETEAPAPEAEIPTPEKEEPAPEKEVPASETEVPSPETEESTPETEVSSPETETPALKEDARGANRRAAEVETFANVMIKSENDLLSVTDIHGNKCFQDANWRKAVFAAVKDGQDNAVGNSIDDALGNFTGEIVAKNKGIADVHGIDRIRKAELIDLRHNEIVDLSYLGQNSGDPIYKEWFGVSSKEAEEQGRDNGTNVTWDFGGNPLEKLPENFGGKIVIAQAGTTSYIYPDDAGALYTYLRPGTEGGTVSGKINVAKSRINKSNVWVNAKLENVGHITKGGYDPINITGFDRVKNDYVTFTNLAKSSSVVKFAVGIDEELHYWTEDEYGTSTPGSQSYKYYLTNRFRIYDKVTVYDDFEGEIILNKVDDTDPTKGLSGAEYELYRANDTLVGKYTTDNKGQIKVTGMPIGQYYFKEVKAPEGYLINTARIEAELTTTTTQVHTVLGGGETEITPSDGAKITATSNERFMVSGNKVDPASADITLSAGAGSNVKGVTVESILDVDGTATPREEVFSNLQEAQNKINNYKNNNKLRGGVTVHVEQEVTSGDKPSTTVTATNKLIPKIDIDVKKIWVDHADWVGHLHPEITIRLLRNGVEVEHVSSSGNKDTEEIFEFKDLPETDQYGKPYVYSVTEDVIVSADGSKGYGTSIKSNTESGKLMFTVTNTWNTNDKVQIAGEKKWKDMGNKLELRPDTVSFMLLQDGAEYATAVASEENGWTFSFNNVPKYKTDNDDVLHQYAIKEISTLPIEYNMPKEIAVDTTGHGDGETVPAEVTNALDPQHRHTTEFSGIKIWEDFGDVYKQRPASIEVELMKNGEATGTIKTVTPDKNGLWNYKFEGLDQYDDEGVDYVYSIRENNVHPRYEAEVRGTDLINVIDPNENEVKVKGQKVWKDYNNIYETRPESVEITLLRNGEKYRTTEASALDKQPWQYSFQSLPKEDETGTPYVYTVKETKVPRGYTSIVAVDNSTITNTLDPKTNELVSISLKKEWKGDKGSEKKRPTVIISILQDKKEIQKVSLKADIDWSTVVKNLPKYNEAGTEIVYTVKEATVSGYKQTNVKWQKGDKENTWTGVFTNTKVEPVKKAPTKPATKTGDTLGALAYIMIALLISALAIVFVVVRKFRKKRK